MGRCRCSIATPWPPDSGRAQLFLRLAGDDDLGPAVPAAAPRRRRWAAAVLQPAGGRLRRRHLEGWARRAPGAAAGARWSSPISQASTASPWRMVRPGRQRRPGGSGAAIEEKAAPWSSCAIGCCTRHIAELDEPHPGRPRRHARNAADLRPTEVRRRHSATTGWYAVVDRLLKQKKVSGICIARASPPRCASEGQRWSRRFARRAFNRRSRPLRNQAGGHRRPQGPFDVRGQRLSGPISGHFLHSEAKGRDAARVRALSPPTRSPRFAPAGDDAENAVPFCEHLDRVATRGERSCGELWPSGVRTPVPNRSANSWQMLRSRIGQTLC